MKKYHRDLAENSFDFTKYRRDFTENNRNRNENNRADTINKVFRSGFDSLWAYYDL